MSFPDDEHELTEAFAATGGPTLRVRAVEVLVAEGPDAGTHARIDRPTFSIGSGTGADLRLNDPSVSREHLRVSLRTDGVHLRDGGSKNGSFVGEVRFADITLSASTNVRVGRTVLSLRLEASPLDLPLSTGSSFGQAIGVSDAMRHLFVLLERAAASDVTVLLEGESGVGKEVLASAIHQRSPRSKGPFVVVDCGAIPPTLIESELFGHEKGAFTGATQAHEGMFEQARDGTLFLDEIGELPLDLQPKLLRVLEQREVRPVGGRSARPIRVRLVAATNRRLSEAARRGEFRQDLFYRLSVARITVPPLRDRADDVVPLARAFLRTLTGNKNAEVPPDLAAILTSYGWPGNVRELRNVMERYALLGVRDAGGLFDESAARLGAAVDDLSRLPFQEARRVAIERFERAYVPKVLERAGGVVAKAAQLAEVARPSFYRMLERLRLPSDGGDES